jgi:hypothetical protein
MGGHF